MKLKTEFQDDKQLRCDLIQMALYGDKFITPGLDPVKYPFYALKRVQPKRNKELIRKYFLEDDEANNRVILTGKCKAVAEFLLTLYKKNRSLLRSYVDSQDPEDITPFEASLVLNYYLESRYKNEIHFPGVLVSGLYYNSLYLKHLQDQGMILCTPQSAHVYLTVNGLHHSNELRLFYWGDQSEID